MSLRTSLFRKSRKGKVHVGKPIPVTGWKPHQKYVIALRHEVMGKRTEDAPTLEEARIVAKDLTQRGWQIATIFQTDR